MSAQSYFAQLRQKLRLAALVPSLSAGLIIGIVEVVLAISFAALIFGGPLNAFLSQGIGIALVGSILSGVCIVLLTSTPGTVSGNQDIPSAALAVAAATVAVSIPARGASDSVLFTTVVVMIGLSTALTGAFFYAIAHFRFGNLVRFLPYPVVGGFLAATGWVLLLGGIGIMVDISPGLGDLRWLFEPAQLVRWAPGVLLASAIIYAVKRIDNVMTLPAIMFGSVAVFYAVTTLSGQGTSTLFANGWLLGPFPDQELWQPLSPADLALVQWSAIVRQIPNIATVVLLSTISLLLNSSGLELALGKEIRINRELRAAGIGNLLAGAGGGLLGFQQLSMSSVSHKVGGASRLTGILAIAICALVLLSGTSILALFPRIVLGAFVSYLGLSFMTETLVSDLSTLPRREYGLILLILFVAATIGFMEAIGLGLLVAVILFVIEYSRADIVRDQLSGTTFQSRVTRSPDKCRILNDEGEQLYILRLQGFIFFGTAHSLLDRVRQRLASRELPRVRYILLDFRHVSGFDSTALFSFVKLVRLVDLEQITLVVAEPVSGLLEQVRPVVPSARNIQVFPDLDHAVEWCEDRLLENAGVGVVEHGALEQELMRHVVDEKAVVRLLSYFERQEVEAGTVLMREGEAADTLFLIESGQLSAYLKEEKERSVRLQTMRDWNVLGEIGFFLQGTRTASVVTEAPSVIYCLSRDALDHMCKNDPDLSSAFHQLIVRLLAERVSHLVSVVDALRD